MKQKEIKLIIDDKLLTEYWEYYKKFHPTARTHPLAKPKAKDRTKGYPFGCSINEFTNLPSRIMQNNLKQNWKSFIVWWCKKEKINGWKLDKFEISYKWVFPTQMRHDSDNYVFFNKFIADGLSEAEVITDDCFGQMYLKLDCNKYVDKENPRVEIIIKELK